MPPCRSQLRDAGSVCALHLPDTELLLHPVLFSLGTSLPEPRTLAESYLISKGEQNRTHRVIEAKLTKPGTSQAPDKS